MSPFRRLRKVLAKTACFLGVTGKIQRGVLDLVFLTIPPVSGIIL